LKKKRKGTGERREKIFLPFWGKKRENEKCNDIIFSEKLIFRKEIVNCKLKCNTCLFDLYF
jgi:hypothetical protein